MAVGHFTGVVYPLMGGNLRSWMLTWWHRFATHAVINTTLAGESLSPQVEEECSPELILMCELI